jgi:hypothetical protein
MRARYTMDDERKIHDDFFGRYPASAGVAENSAAEESLDDMFL